MSELILPTPNNQLALPQPQTHDHIYVTDRDLHEIEELHNLRTKDFRNKVVADLGCGISTLAEDLKIRNIGATVISLDLNFPALAQAKSKANSEANLVQARLEALPLRDSSVDLALASFSLPYWATDPDQINNFLREGRRILKVNGLFSITPISVGMLGPFKSRGHDWLDMSRQLMETIESVTALPKYRAHFDEESRNFTLLRLA